jgi:hypothetical protein
MLRGAVHVFIIAKANLFPPGGMKAPTKAVTPSFLTWERPVGAALVNESNTYRSGVLELHLHYTNTHTRTQIHMLLMSVKAELLCIECHVPQCTVPHSTSYTTTILASQNLTVTSDNCRDINC